MRFEGHFDGDIIQLVHSDGVYSIMLVPEAAPVVHEALTDAAETEYGRVVHSSSYAHLKTTAAVPACEFCQARRTNGVAITLNGAARFDEDDATTLHACSDCTERLAESLGTYLDINADDLEWRRERRQIHERARNKWREQKRRERLLQELEANQHQFHMPPLPTVTDDVKSLCQQYVSGELSIVELEQELGRVFWEQFDDD